MAEMLKFKKGLFANLPEVSELTVGTIYVTTDEQAMYVDVAKDKRIRLSDIIQVQTVDELASYAPDYSTSALYYVIDSNALLKFVRKTDEGKYEWKQINRTSDIEADIAELAETVKDHGDSITGINTAIENITKADGLIATAKQEAINAAAADATSKANAAKAAAIADADGKFEVVNAALDTKVATETFNTTVAGLEKDIAAAESAAKSHAETKAAAAETAAKSYADTKVSEAKTEIQGKLDLKADASAVSASVTELEGKISAAEGRANTYAETKATAAETAAKTYADGLKTTIDGTIAEGLDGKVDKTVYNETIATLETKADAAKNLVEAKSYAETKATAAETAAKAHADSLVEAHTTAVNAELAKKANVADVADTVAGLNTAIAEAEGRAKSHAETKASEAQAAAEATAAAALKTAKEALEGSIEKLSGVVDGKVDQNAYSAQVEQIGKDIAAAEGRAAADATSKANKALADAKEYTNGREEVINAAIDLKADKSALETTVSNLTTAIGTAKQEAINAAATDATSKANAAEAAAKSHTNTEIGKVNTALDNKLDKATFNTFVGAKATADTAASGIYADIDAAQAAAEAYADVEIAKALQGADAMTFKGVLGGEGNTAALPAAADTNAGDTWKIGAAGTYAGFVCRVGDLLVAKADKSDKYWHISSGYEAENNSVLTEKEDGFALVSPVGSELGNVTFVADDSAATVSVVNVCDPATKITSATVTVGMAWDEF